MYMSVSKLVTIQSSLSCLLRWVEKNTATSCFKGVEHVVEVAAKRRPFLVTSVAPIPTLKMVRIVWTAARHRADCHPHLEKILINCCWRLALRVNKGGRRKNKGKKNEKNEKTEEQKKYRNQRKAGKVQQVVEGGGVQVGTCEGPGRCQPSPLRKNI